MTSDQTEVQVRAALPNTASMLSRWRNEASLQDSNGVDAAMQIFEGILGAETEEELFAAQDAGTIASKDFTDRPFRLRGPEDISIMHSRTALTEAGGFPFFLLLRVCDVETGQDLVINTGAQSVLAVIDRLVEWELDPNKPEDRKPFQPYRPAGRGFMFTSKTTMGGTDVIMLKPVNLGRPASASAPSDGKRTSRK